MTLDRHAKIGVVGAGAMGSGIAQLAASHGHPVVLHDVSATALEKGTTAIAKNLSRLVEKGRVSVEESENIKARIVLNGGDETDSTSLDAFHSCGIIIEAVVEDATIKHDLFTRLDSVVGKDAILATNTSSLSVTSIARASSRPQRVIGIHFFNPPTVMPLVEIVPGVSTSESVVNGARSLVDSWGKTTVLASDTPGFIVNRIARPFYGEAIRIYEEGIADFATIDWAMRDLGGFKMGPFELMDFIGNDVNFAVTRSVFEAMYFDQRYKPSVTQQRLFEAGMFGRKSGRGYYNYTSGTELPEPKRDAVVGQQIVDRILAMLINEAADAVLFRVASPSDIDTAMIKGVNYPKGLLAWADEIGIPAILQRLEALQQEYGEDRYRPSALLRRMAAREATFFNTQSANFNG